MIKENIKARLSEEISKPINIFSQREEEIIKLRCGMKDGRYYTLEDVGNKFGVTRERIRQIEASCIKKLDEIHK